MDDATASRSPLEVENLNSLSEKAQKLIRDLAEQLVADALATVNEGLKEQVALLHIENEDLREKNQRLDEENRVLRQAR